MTAAEVMDRSVIDLTCPPASRPLAQNILAKLRTGKAWTGEMVLQRKDGSTFPALVTDSPILDAEGAITRIIGLTTDLRSIKRVEESLRQSEALYRSVTENFPDGTVSIFDRELRMTFVAGSGLARFGLTADDLLNKSFAEISLPETIRIAVPHLRAALAGQVRRYEAPHENGTVFAVVAAPLPGPDGHISEILVVSQDITEKRLAEAAARRALEEIARLHDLSQSFTQSLDPATVGAQALKTVAELMHCERGCIVLAQDDDRSIGVLAYQDLGFAPEDWQEEVSRINRLLARAEHGIMSWVVRHGIPVRLDQVKDDSRYLEGNPAIQSELCVPLQARGRTIGALNIESRAPAAFSEHDQRVLTLLANQMAVAIDNARLFQAEHDQRALAEALRQSAETLNSTLDTDTLLDSLLALAAGVIPYDAGNIFWVEGGQVRLARVTGHTQREQAESDQLQKIPLAELPLMQRSIETRQPYVVSDTHAAAGWAVLPERGWVRSNVCAPIIVADQVSGFISLSSLTPGFYAGPEAERLQIFTQQVGFALSNARLFNQVRQGQARLRELSTRLAETEQNERRLISRELHDRVGQNLTALGINLNLARNQLGQQSTESTSARLAASLDMLAQITDHIRDVMAELHPPVLDEYGLAASLRWIGERFTQTTDLAVMVDAQPLQPRLPPAKSITLLRIAQEALTNVAKHAHASQATLRLEDGPEAVRLTVADNGIGFDPEAQAMAPGAHWGMLTMRERAEAAGGRLRVHSAPGDGTRVIIEMPR